MKRDIENSEHYVWGEACDGWILLPDRAMMVIQEHMPPHTAEKRHFHEVARQFFYVLSGELTMELDGEYHRVPAMSGIAIPPTIRHQALGEGQTLLGWSYGGLVALLASNQRAMRQVVAYEPVIAHSRRPRCQH